MMQTRTGSNVVTRECALDAGRMLCFTLRTQIDYRT